MSSLISSEFIGISDPILMLKAKVTQIANSSETILIEGETGTGKSLLAKVIHAQSLRQQYPFIDVACGAFSKYLLESELFGHVKGAFTGANISRKGKFLTADSGTLFLDEIGDIGSNVQAKLVKIIEEKRFFPVGSDKELCADVRLIAATNQPLIQLVNTGKFRKDLYYRLNRLSLYIPPLRERIPDIPVLIDHIFAKFAVHHHICKRLSEKAQEKVLNYSWPGNVRELESVLVGAFLSSESIIIDEDLIVFQQYEQEMFNNANVSSLLVEKPSERAINEWIDYHINHHHNIIEEFEQYLLQLAWKRYHGNKKLIAQELHISRGKLYRYLEKYQSMSQNNT